MARWHQELTRQTSLNQATIADYVRDVHPFAAWLLADGQRDQISAVTVQDARHYRDYLLALGCAPAPVNRALVSLAWFMDAVGRQANHPFRRVARVEQVDRPPRALSYTTWLAMAQAAEQ